MIESTGLSVLLGGTHILHDVRFSAPPGLVTAIIGPNGSGKTTLMRALSGEVRYEGTATINGKDIAALKPWEAAGMRAVLPQATSLSFPFTVREIVRLGLTYGGTSTAGNADLIDRALARVDLAGFAGRFYQELSGGEQQRVQLARVLCQVWKPVVEGVPRYLFLDEPVSSLDIRHQLVIMRIARDFAAGGGGVVAILHDLNLTAMFADRVAAIHRGRVEAQGTPGEVMNDALLDTVYGCPLRIGAVPHDGIFVLPQSAGA